MKPGFWPFQEPGLVCVEESDMADVSPHLLQCLAQIKCCDVSVPAGPEARSLKCH
ncbi:hypothetical protein ATPR_0907 [Acetobacter tropicalis NBRC 101654]|uniref:Uncharacterized protein n=1 Tax=Acetobacter tropicalis NBRC 101654 TaxID=749388 RepID=F7VC08_9PROT|nr:hypothetical protein ATPR_0907 [Acetobacter tropicalis NBRC 101654]